VPVTGLKHPALKSGLAIDSWPCNTDTGGTFPNKTFETMAWILLDSLPEDPEDQSLRLELCKLIIYIRLKIGREWHIEMLAP